MLNLKGQCVLEQYKKDPQSMELDVTGRELVLQQ